MKKRICYTMCLFILFILPVFASNWKYLYEGMLVDIESNRKSTECYYGNSCYSVWIKRVSDDTKMRYLIECNSYQYSIVDTVSHTQNQKGYWMNHRAIVPDSIEETIYNFVCKNELPKVPSSLSPKQIGSGDNQEQINENSMYKNLFEFLKQ